MPVIPSPVLISVSHDNCGQNKTNNITDTKLASETNRTISVECVGVHLSCKVLLNNKRDVGGKSRTTVAFVFVLLCHKNAVCLLVQRVNTEGPRAQQLESAVHSTPASQASVSVEVCFVYTPLSFLGFCPLVKNLMSTSQLQAMIHCTHIPEEAHPSPFPFC
jgi:hypothetical protein